MNFLSFRCFLVFLFFLPTLTLAETPAENAEVCIANSVSLVPAIDGTPFERREGILCDEEDTGFFRIRVRHHLSSHLPHGGLEQLFHQRAHLYLDAQAEGREIRLSYDIAPYDAKGFWAMTVTDSAGNTRENRDFLWARNFHAYDRTMPSALLLGEPLVYFSCTDREGLTCVANYTIDKCYAGMTQREASSRMYYDVSVAAIGPANVEKLFSDYERINQIAEAVLATVSPAACQH